MKYQFKNQFALVSFIALTLLSACGRNFDGKSTRATMSGPPSTGLDNTTIILPGIRTNYTISRTSTGFAVTDVGIGGGVTLIELPRTKVRFSDVTVNLLVGDKSKSIPPAKLKSLIELYIAFFNRVPDADGVSYWIDQINGGMTVEQLANNFYNAAILYSSLTGYSGTMSNADFVKIIYKNVLGRNEVDPEGLDYWTTALAKPVGSIGAETRGTLINTILNSAHNFKGDSQYGWVADLLENKVNIATYFSIQQGLNYNTAEESISKGMEIASVVTAIDTAVAREKITGSESTFDLRIAASPTVSNDRRSTIKLQSDSGDIIGDGQAYAYDLTNAKIEVKSEKNRLVVTVHGDETWGGVFQIGGIDQSELKVGLVTDADRYEDGQAWSKSAVTWAGEGRSCYNSKGWFAIDNVKYSGTRLTEISLRFERHCNGAVPSLHGQIKYYADDTSKPPPPVVPVPAALWKPPSDLANSIGNYAYFESENGDYVGLGKSYRYDQRTAMVSVSGDVSNLVISVKGNEVWTAELRGMITADARLSPGYYPRVKGSRFDNEVKGGLSWTGDGRGCSKSNGWFAIDAIQSDNYGSPIAFDLRFEQHCEGRAAALHGFIHWVDPRLTTFLPVTRNSTVGSWRAPVTALPSNGNYFYVQSDPGERLGKGLVALQTNSTARIDANVQGNVLTFDVRGVHDWQGNFIAKLGQNQFVSGEYANMETYPSQIAAGGALSVYGDGYVNNNPKGWLVIDNISYVSGKLAAVDLRFEQLGLDDAGMLHGQLHWQANQSNNFIGPMLQAPNTFWHPRLGRTPAIGNYVYLESDRSDFVGDQPSYSYTPLDSALTVKAVGNTVDFNVSGDENWHGRFVTMGNLNQIQVGYYSGLSNSEYGNPAKGNFSWSGNGHGCNTATSGVVVDKATYTNGQLVELQLRFEQHCENEPGAMRGEIHWAANDLRQPAGPTAPVPSNLWHAPAGILPTSGNYLYVTSDLGDPIGAGMTDIAWLMTSQDTKFTTSTSAMRGNEAYFRFGAESSNKKVGDWTGEFQAMVGIKQFQVGFYDRTLRYPFQNWAFGGLSWRANGVGCNTSTGWFAIDKVTYVENRITSIHARFEQHCEFAWPALRGELNWEASPSSFLAPSLKQEAPPINFAGTNSLNEITFRKSRIQNSDGQREKGGRSSFPKTSTINEPRSFSPQ